jgi:hypothetical protein
MTTFTRGENPLKDPHVSKERGNRNHGARNFRTIATIRDNRATIPTARGEKRR